jgi:hypothetical protein
MVDRPPKCELLVLRCDRLATSTAPPAAYHPGNRKNLRDGLLLFVIY